MDTYSTILAIHTFAIGVLAGLTSVGFFVVKYLLEARNRPEDRPTPPQAPELNIGIAMSNLCSAVHRMNPNWNRIEITRESDSNASMSIKSDNSEGGDPGNKLH